MPNLYTVTSSARQKDRWRALGGSLKPFCFARQRSLPPLFCTVFLLSSVLIGCASSLDYITGLYEQEPNRQVDVLVRVKDKNDIALTDLTLNDFYVKHNGYVLERRNNLRLNEELSTVKLYLVILVDQRENPELKNSFELTRAALKAYLTLQSENIYIKLISYDTEARALNEDFSNDSAKLQVLMRELGNVQTEEAPAFEEALAMAQQSIESLPKGAYTLEPEESSSSAKHHVGASPLYNSAIILMNQNSLPIENLRSYVENLNFVVLDSTGKFSNDSKYFALSGGSESNNLAEVATIFEVYEIPPRDLNEDIDQTKAVKIMNQAWDTLNNIVNGYYWLTYNKYTDFNKGNLNRVGVSLNQYGRAKDSGLLTLYGDQDDIDAKVAVDLMVDQSPAVSDTMPELGDMIADSDILPPALTELGTLANQDLLGIVPAQYQDWEESYAVANMEYFYPPESQVIADEPVIDDFEILKNLNSGSIEGSLVSDRDETVPQFTAEPIQLVSSEVSLELAEGEEEREAAEVPAEFRNGRYIQVGSFLKLENLYDVIERLSGDYDVRAVTSKVNGKVYNRCIIGPFVSEEEADQNLQKLKSADSREWDAFIIRKSLTEWVGN